ncbi:carboxymuconolactone decarboxylase family protein [Xylophilus sp. GOD-11R]|uniref:carboxymuconolactone decarboxylase family protein n=1 Tax=Xylophilus sp. GOD-11R TaxID=3089814 RepID=UPI00298CA421|nr:carboxymuconolactone decarboxylase family protein [Xylophilus sp. GOD-11R]WPB56072.1 carboxymuconolactone decarboxylase family protein [Xylophilus sp. GOD-11R]
MLQTDIPHSSRLPLRPPPYEAHVSKLVESSAFSGLSPVNLRRALAHHPQLAAAFQSMAHVVLFGGAVGEREREISIIRTGALTRSEYEWGMHVSIYADKCGLSDAQIHELTCCASWTELSEGLWTQAERLVVRMVDELHRHSTLSDAAWRELNATWPQEQVMELIFSSSFYHMAAFFLNSAAVPLEAGQARFPAGVSQAAVPDD